LSEWKKQEDTIRKECQERARLGALQRCRVTGAGTKAKYQQLEVAVLNWMDEQEAAGIESKPGVLWTQVEIEAQVAGIDPKVYLQENWRRAFKRHHNVRFVKVKRVSSLTVEERINLTMSRLAGSLFENFCLLGYVYTKHTSDIKLFTIPEYKYEKKDEVVQQFEADEREAAQPATLVSALQLPEASRKPKQLCISSLFQAKS